MARDHVPDGILRGCPTCGTKVDDAHLGLRDFRWVNKALPGKVGGMDVDFVITQAPTRRALHLELKPKGARVSWGARLTFALYVQVGFDAWAVWDQGDGTVQRGVFDARGRVTNVVSLSQDELAEDIAAWWDAGLHEEEA